MIAVDEVHVSMAGRTKQDEVSRRLARDRMGGCVSFAEIRLGFDHAPRQNSTIRFADQQLSQHRARDIPGIAIEEVRRQQSSSQFPVLSSQAQN